MMAEVGIPIALTLRYEVTCVLLPYGEELPRCVRTGRKNKENRKNARGDAAHWSAARFGKGR